MENKQIVSKTRPYNSFGNRINRRVDKFERSLEDLALVELPSLEVGAFPLEVLLYQFFGLVRLGVELLPVIRVVIDLPIGTQLEGEVLAAPNPDPGDGGVVVLAK